jgi:hypothetical protein
MKEVISNTSHCFLRRLGKKNAINTVILQSKCLWKFCVTGQETTVGSGMVDKMKG